MKSPILMLTALVLLACAFVAPGKEKVFTLKKFEKKKLALVQPGLYACKFEATHLEYNAFLADLKAKGDSALWEKTRIRNENWNINHFAYGEPFIHAYHAHPAYAEYPVVNVSHEAVSLFCDWLSEQYNSYPKRQFANVKFRLPTHQEWMKAALAGRASGIFPWNGSYLRNPAGRYLANFRRAPEEDIKVDWQTGKIEWGKSAWLPSKGQASLPNGVHFTAPVYSSPQNGFGIHHLSGNVAEMLAEPGHTKGGSWFSSGYYLRLDAEDEHEGFTEPAPEIGFRYFMEVLEN